MDWTTPEGLAELERLLRLRAESVDIPIGRRTIEQGQDVARATWAVHEATPALITELRRLRDENARLSAVGEADTETMTYRELLARLEKTAGPWRAGGSYGPTRRRSALHGAEAGCIVQDHYGWALKHAGCGHVEWVREHDPDAACAAADAALAAAGWTLVDDLDAALAPAAGNDGEGK